MWRKFGAGLAAAGAFGATGTVALDAEINPYEVSLDKYELTSMSTIEEAGDNKVIAHRDRPAVSFSKWDRETAMTVAYVGLNAAGSRQFLTDRIEWEGDNEELHAYPLPASEGMEDGGFEIEVYLRQRPESNTFRFAVEGADELDFFYQPELTAEEIAEDSVRPENVIGSYAVYHKTKANHVEGQTNYGTGKAFHVYRPKAIDANGEEVWADLAYLEGVLSVTVPEKWLTAAAYPVIVDPTIGYTTAGATSGNDGGTTLYSQVTALETATTANVSIYCSWQFSGSAAISVGWYSDLSNNPNTRVTTAGTLSDCQNTAAWQTGTLTASIVSGTSNHFGMYQGSGSIRYHWDTGLGGVSNTNTGFVSLPATATAAGTNTGRTYSIYATYTLSPGATFGLTANNASTQTQSADRKYVYSATPASSGTVKGGVGRVWLSAAGNSQARLVIYSDSAGSPNALLAQSDQVTISNTSEAAQSFSFSGANQIAITSGTPYWIGVHFSDPGTPNFTISRANTASLTRSDPDTYSDGPANPCSCGTSSNGGLDIYIEYTEATAGASAPPDDGLVFFE